MINKARIIEENAVRLGELRKDIDPYTGKGAAGEREEVHFSDIEEPLYLPKSFINSPIGQDFAECGSFPDYAKKYGMALMDAVALFNRARFDHDFEFWSIVCVIIQDKETLEDVKFKLRVAQQILLEALEEMRLAGKPIRFVLLKARQWGGSTLVQMYMFWIQQIHRKNWHLAICAQDDGAANNISELYRRASVTYPEELAVIRYKPYARSPKNIVNIERGGIIGVGSINNPDQFRSYNYPMVHISEPGIWQDTPKRTAAQLVTSLRSNVPRRAYTLVGLESTAKGVGSFFHNEWLAAQSKKSAYKGVFVPWFMIDMYTEDIDSYPVFIDSMTTYDWEQWELGATLEGINWYRKFKEAENYDDWMMFNEYPSTPEEAFIASGQRYFPAKIIEPLKESLTKPINRFIISPDRVNTKEELKRTEFEVNPRGTLSIWSMPTTEVTLKGVRYRVVNRYCGAADIGGTHKDADFSHLTILDRYWMLFGGWPQLAATWHGHLHQDLFARVCAQTCWKFDKAMLAIETNSLKKEKGEGDHFLTVLDTIKDFYDNLYVRNMLENTEKDWVPKYGFHTNSGSKDMILGALRAGMRDGKFTEKDYAAYKEYGFFERKPDGTLGAISGQHDDIVMSRALAYWLATTPTAMPAVKLVPIEDEYGIRKKKSGAGAMGII